MKVRERDIEREILSERVPRARRTAWGVSTGCTLTNLALAGSPDYGLLPGEIQVWPGGSGAAKTWLLLQTFAEACRNKRLDGYELRLVRPERGDRMNYRKFFGREIVRRLDRGHEPATVEEFYYSMYDLAKSGKPFLAGLDSEDALSSKDEEKKFRQQKRAFEKREEAKGSYGDGKAKKHAAGLRVVNHHIGKSGSILIVIKQAKDNIGWDSYANPLRYSGGRSFKFYANNEVWFTVGATIKEKVLDKDRVVGHYVNVRVRKNRHTGQDAQVKLRFYPSYGLDELGSNLDYLIDEGVWIRKGGVVTAPDLGLSGREAALLRKIEERGLERDVQLAVSARWHAVLEAGALKRKPRYT